MLRSPKKNEIRRLRKKDYTFGGDYVPVEMVPGHAAIARQGLAQALSELFGEGWIRSADVGDLIEALMRGNAHRIFSYEETLQNWK